MVGPALSTNRQPPRQMSDRVRGIGATRVSKQSQEPNKSNNLSNRTINLRNRRCMMGSGGNKQNRSITRRHFLKTSGVAAGAAGLAPALSAPFVSTALAQTKTLKILQWSHFVPQF